MDRFVYIVDDDEAVRDSLRLLLESNDIEIRDYRSADDFLQADAADMACLLLDLHMPGTSGLELLRLLRSSGGVHQPIILLGEEADVSAAVTAMREGAVDFFEKPHVDIIITRRVAYLLDHSATAVH